MGSHHPEPHGPCLHVYVLFPLILPTAWLMSIADYYYYATAGGARIWVRPITVLSYLLQQIH